jgi:hypothetical protein
VPIDTVTVAPETGVAMSVPGEAVVMATSVDPDAAPGGSGGAGGGAAGGAAGSGGTGGAAAGGTGGTAPPAATPESDESGCACATPAPRRPAQAMAPWLTAALMAFARRRSRR